MLTTHLQPVPRLRMSGATLLLPVCLHEADRNNWLSVVSSVLVKFKCSPSAVLAQEKVSFTSDRVVGSF